MKKFKQCEWSYKPVIFSFSVGITWDDAPTDQHAVINTDYKIRCVVLASPPATIDWLKESLIVSTGRILHTHHYCKTLKKVFFYYTKLLPLFLLPFGRELLCTLLLLRTYLLLYKTVVDFSFFNTLFLKNFFLFSLFPLSLFSSSHAVEQQPSIMEIIPIREGGR